MKLFNNKNYSELKLGYTHFPIWWPLDENNLNKVNALILIFVCTTNLYEYKKSLRNNAHKFPPIRMCEVEYIRNSIITLFI